MRARPTSRLLLGTELARCRLRPVVGRLPVLAGAVAVAVTVFAQPARDSLTDEQLAGAISLAATPGVLVAFAVGAAVAHDVRSSGSDATDRTLVGRPLALGVSQALAIAAWLALVAAAVAIAVTATVLIAAAARGHGLGDARSPVPVSVSGLRFCVAGAAAAAVGHAAAKLTGSASAAIGGFVVLLLIGDGTLVTIHPQLAAAALPDNLLGLGSGELEGLAIRGASTAATTSRALLGALMVVGGGVALDSRRDLL